MLVCIRNPCTAQWQEKMKCGNNGAKSVAVRASPYLGSWIKCCAQKLSYRGLCECLLTYSCQILLGEHYSCWLALSPPTHWDLCLDLWFMSDSAKWVVDLAARMSLVWGFQKPLIRGKSTETISWEYKVSALYDNFRDFFLLFGVLLTMGKSCTLLPYPEPLWIFKLYFSQ